MSKEREARKVVKVGMRATGVKGVNGSKEEIFDSLGKQDEKDTIEHLRAQLRERDGIIRKYQESRGGQIEIARRVCEAVKATRPYPLLKYKPLEPSSSEVSAVANLSDTHFGEFERSEETGGFGGYNFQIGEDRLYRYGREILGWVGLNRRSYTLKNLHIFGNGDYISGGIHQELLVTAEAPVPVQTARAGAFIAEMVRRVAPHFEKVYFHAQGADNHGRLQPKPQAKQKSSNNFSFLVHALIEAYLKDHPNVKVIHYEDMKPLVEVSNHRFLLEHGDNVKAFMNIPYYGMERVRGREAVRRMGSGREFDYMQIGHWHCPSIISGNIHVNGALSGTSAYDHSCGRHSPPAQVTYLVHPKWGIFNWTAWQFGVGKKRG